MTLMNVTTSYIRLILHDWPKLQTHCFIYVYRVEQNYRVAVQNRLDSINDRC